MILTKVREGRSQTEVLATIAEYQYDEKVLPRQKNIVKKLPLSKGSVSNTCKKLLDSNIIVEKDKKYKIQKRTLLSLYREHIEDYLRHETKTSKFQDLVDAHNSVRTKAKKQLRTIFNKDASSQILFHLLIRALIESLKSIRTQTLREVFLSTDYLLNKMANYIVSSNAFQAIETDNFPSIRALFLLAVGINQVHPQFEQILEQHPFLEQFFPGNCLEKEMITHLKEET